MKFDPFKCQLVKVSWIDASDAHSQWSTPEEWDKYSALSKCESVGWAVRGKDEIKLFINRGKDDDGSTTVANGIVIPMKWVTSIQRLSATRHKPRLCAKEDKK